MAATDPRAAARQAFLAHALGRDDVALERASFDAGFRSYWRTCGTNPSLVVMDSPPALEDPAPWLAMQELLAAHGVPVPHVFAADRDAGFLLLEDLGPKTALDVADEGSIDALIERAFDVLVGVGKIAVGAGFPRYDAAFLEKELRIFDEWLLGRHLGFVGPTQARARIDEAYRFLVDAALAQPRVLVHRDFMLRNLMPQPGGHLALIDFQGALLGPAAYDIASLMKDAFISWPGERTDGWIARWHARAGAEGIALPPLDRFRRDVDLIGVQRHLKILGVFARLHHRDHKPRYLADGWRFVGYLEDVLPRYPELAPIRQLMRDIVAPAFVRGNHKEGDTPCAR